MVATIQCYKDFLDWGWESRGVIGGIMFVVGFGSYFIIRLAEKR
jgi:hypothetical protein